MGNIYFWGACLVMQFVPQCTLTLPTQPANDCEGHQYYDEDRLVCLDLCGQDDNVRCTVEFYCSTRESWASKFNPSICLNHCYQPCEATSYCDHASHMCLPCESLCSGSDKKTCRIYCYDVFLSMSTLPHDFSTTAYPVNKGTTEWINATTKTINISTGKPLDSGKWLCRLTGFISFICGSLITGVALVMYLKFMKKRQKRAHAMTGEDDDHGSNNQNRIDQLNAGGHESTPTRITELDKTDYLLNK